MSRLLKPAPIPAAADQAPSLRLAGRASRRPGVGASPLACDDLLTGAELSRAEIEALFETATAMKRDPASFAGALAGKSVVMLFEKASLRTRVTFDVGLYRLGAQAVYLDHQSSKIGEREAVKDYGKNLERWCHAIVARTDRHAVQRELADAAGIPVINALCDRFHPCQALADYLTLRDTFGSVEGLRLAYVGDGNNVCHSLMLVGARLGVNLTVITPDGHEPDDSVLQQARAISALGGGWVDATHDLDAIEGAQAVYTDTWTSMGDAETPARLAAFEPYRVDAALMARAASVAGHASGGEPRFLHCLPAHRGQEVTDEVIDADTSLVYDQAENRLHAQAALLLHLLAPAAAPAGGAGPRLAARVAR